MVEVTTVELIFASTSLVTIAAAFARAEVKQRGIQKGLDGKAEKDVVEVQLKAMDEKLDLMIEHFSIRR